SIGYSNYHETLNAKDFGVPQKRERAFMVSILGEHEPYVFPKQIKLEKRLKDVIEDEVAARNYLDNERAQQLIAKITDVKDIEAEIKQVLQYNSENRENTQRFRTYDPSGIAPTLNTMQGGGLEPHIPVEGIPIINNTKKGYLMATDGEGIDLAKAKQRKQQGREKKDMPHTL